MANNVFFPAIKKYDSITSSDFLLFYPIVSNSNKYEGGIDGLPRKMTITSLLTFLNSNLSISSSSVIEVKDSGVSINTNFTKLNFTGPLVTVTDSTGGEAAIDVSANLVSDLSDVSPEAYVSLTDIVNGTLNSWSANKPHYTSNALWVSNYDTGTYMIGYDPVNDIWRPMLAKDYFSNGSLDTNFATDNLTFTANRTHNISGFDLVLQDGTNSVLTSTNSSQRSSFGYGGSDYVRVSKTLNTLNVVLGGGSVLDLSTSLATLHRI